MRYISFTVTPLCIGIVALGVVGCSSGDSDKAAPAKSAAMEKSPVPAQSGTPTAKASPVAQASSLNGAELYKAKTCIACHGADGKTPIMSTYPKIAGQNDQYLTAQMQDIKNGARSNGQSAAMKGIMHLVSDEETTAIAQWLAGLK